VLRDLLIKIASDAAEPVKTLGDISDNTANNRDESFITPVVKDAPPRSIEDNETEIYANATDKAEPVKETLKAAVKDEIPATAPQGPAPRGNLKDEERAESAAEAITAPVAETAPAEELNTALKRTSGDVRGVVDDLNAKLKQIIEIKPQIDAVAALMDQLGKACKAPRITKFASAWGTAALGGLGLGALGLGIGSGLASPSQASATRQWADEYDRDIEEDRGRDWADDIPDFEARAKRYALYGSRATQARVFGLGVPAMMDMAHDFSESLKRPDLVDHYANFKRGPTSGYIQMLRERDRWADAAGMPNNQFHVQRGNDFYKDKPVIYRGERRRGLDFNNDLRREVIKRIAKDALKHPTVSQSLGVLGLGGMDAAQLAAELEKQNIVETPRVVGREGSSPRPIANEIMFHADNYAKQLYGRGVSELTQKEQEAIFEGLNDHIAQVDPKLWMRKRYIDNEIGYWTPSALSMYGPKLIRPLNTIRNLSLIGGIAAGALGLGAGGKWLYDKFKSGSPQQKTAEALEGGLADGKPDTAFKPKALAKGIETESEHTNKPQVAKEIAKDHLTEDGDYYDKLEKMEKTAEIDVLTGAPGAGKTTAARRHRNGYDVVVHGDMPLKMTDVQRRVAVVKKIREAMRSHNMGKRVLVDSAPRQLKRSYQPLLNAAKRVIILDVPADVAEAGFAKRTKSTPEKAAHVVRLANASLTDLRSDPRASIADRETIGAALRKAAASSEAPHTPARPLRRRVEVLVVDGINVFGVEKPYHQGGVWFPGGGVEGPEEKFADAAVREVKEETGIEIAEIHRLDGIDPVECVWDQDANSENPKWAEKAKHWRGDRTYFYVATAKKTGKATGDDPLKGVWLPMKQVLSRLEQSVFFDNKGWQPLTKARLAAVANAMPKVRKAPRAA
jgi:8-oxo-dGTP pyrophosphatase MutT (NUDIX family)